MQLLLMCLGVGIPLYSFICFALWQWQNRLIFLPSRRFQSIPEEFEMSFESIDLRVEEGENISSWWIPHPNAMATVLFLHGNGLNMGANLNLAQAKVFHELGLSVLMIDYRGYGQSYGKQFPTEEQAYSDAQIALDYLTQSRQIDPKGILVYGHSLGGAIALHLATDNPNIAALMIQSSFTRMRDMADHDKIYKLFPINWILRYEFDSLSRVKQLKLPILFTHGDQDKRVPDWMSQSLYDASISPHKALYFVPEADHDHIPEVGGEMYAQKVKQFIDSVFNEVVNSK